MAEVMTFLVTVPLVYVIGNFYYTLAVRVWKAVTARRTLSD